jgi:hypothetical protein
LLRGRRGSEMVLMRVFVYQGGGRKGMGRVLGRKDVGDEGVWCV